MAMDRLMSGCMDSVPNACVSTIRVFFSSTFTDMSDERNLLMKEAVPELRRYCHKKGFDFEVVDMRWGIREDAATDHSTVDIILKEIENCQAVSAGTNFVLFVGDKYGSRTLPNAIPVTEFRLFRRIASWLGLKFEMVEKWYLLDTNTVPHVYRILPITALLPFYGNLNPVNQGMQKVHQQNWESDERNIRNVLRKVATVAVQQNKITQQESSKYFISVTENEIQKGIYTYSQVQNHVIYFERTLININLQDRMAKRYTDLTKNGELDEEVQELRERMKRKLLPTHVPSDQTVHNVVNWTTKGIDPDFDEHGRYLTMFCEAFKALMQRQIDVGIKQVNESKIENEIMNESAVHLRLAKHKCSCFFGQEQLLRDVMKAMENGFVPRPKVEKKEEEVTPIEEAEEDGNGFNAETDESNEDLEKKNENEGSDGLDGDGDNKADNQDENTRKSSPENNAEDNDNDSEMNEEDEELEKLQNDKMNEMEKLRQTYVNMKNGPTFAAGDMADETGTDPSRSTREELTYFKRTRKTRRPVIVYGPSGCGKTALLAKLGRIVKTWQPNAVLVIRFLGTTSNTVNVRPMLISVIQSIWAAYKINRPMDLDFNSDMIYLGQYLQALIWQVSSPERPLYIVLDSLDQLHPNEQAHSLAWLPTILPQDCAIVLSTLPDTTNCLDSARRLLRSDKLFIQVKDLTVEAADKIISAQCNSRGREVTRPQRNFLLDRFRECPTPLYLQLTLNQALHWRSHQQVKDLILGSDVFHAINHLLMKTERNHGIVLVSKAFGYLASMRQGVSTLEMEDLLSLDNEALQDTFIFHLPPDPEHIRIPNSLWSQIMADVKDVLASEMVSGRSLQKWYHRYIAEVAGERYLTEETRVPLHRMVAQYFMGYWHGRNKPLSLFKGKIGWYPENTREVPDQPLVSQDGNLNVRKLTELPYHLALAGMWREFHEHVTTNIDWLVAKVKAFGVSELKMDLMLMLLQRDRLSEELVKDKEDEPIILDEDQEENEDNGEKKKLKSKEKAKGKGKKKDKAAEDENTSKDIANEELLKMYNQIDSDLFITESTIVQDINKGNEPAENGEKEKDEPEKEGEEKEEDAAENEYVLTLATALRDLEILIDIVTLGVECIRQSPNNLPVQITCQLGKSRALTPGLKKLVADCYEWMECTQIPLMVPQDACMPPPGQMLQTTLSADVYISGADRKHDYPVKLSMVDNYLYVMEQSNRKYDTLRVLDLDQGGEYVMVEDTRCYVHSLRLNDNEKFIILRVYEKPSVYDASFYCRLYERNRLAPYTLDKRAKYMDVSKTGDLVAYADDHICFISSPVPETLTLHIIYLLHHQEVISGVLFSPDAYFLLTFIPGDGFKVWVPRRGESTLTIEGTKDVIFKPNPPPDCLHRVTANHRLLQVLSSYSERHKVRVYNLSSGEIIHTLVSPELNYGITMMELDSADEFALVATDDTGILNGNLAKSALLWDLESGSVASRITSPKPFTAIRLLVQSKTIYVLAALWRDPVITVYNLGTIHRPMPGAKVVRQIHGHSTNILQMELAINAIPETGGDRLISVASDNTIRVWDLKQVLTPASKAKTVDLGAVIALTYNKESKIVYLATDKGVILQQCTETGEKTTLTDDLEDPPHILRLSKNGRLLMVAVKNMIYVYHVDTGELEYKLESCSNSSISCMAENGNILVAGHAGMEGQGRIWDLSNGNIVRDVTFLYSFYSTAVSPSGTQFGMTMFEYPIMVGVYSSLDEASNISMEQIDSMMAASSHLVFSPDSSMLVSTSNDGRIRIVDTENGHYLHTMVQSSSITCLAFTYDSKRLLTGGYRSIYIWNVGVSDEDLPPEARGQLEVKLTRHTNFVTCLQLVLEDRFLVTASVDKSIALWSMKTRTTLSVFRYHCAIYHMQAAPNLSSIAFVPERSSAAAVLTLNKAAREALSGIPSVPVPVKVKKAQAVALSFSSQHVTTKTSTACSIL